MGCPALCPWGARQSARSAALLPFAELGVDQVAQGRHRLLLIRTFGLDLDLRPEASRQHHHAHDALGVDPATRTRQVNFAAEPA